MNRDELRERVARAIRKARKSENFCSLCDKPYKKLIHCSCEEMADAALAAIEGAGYSIVSRRSLDDDAADIRRWQGEE